jgi:hypothetical protein
MMNKLTGAERHSRVNPPIIDGADVPSRTASFSRFMADDLLCCPSSTSTVQYSIVRAPQG